jgi:hypothetical protein
LWRCGDDLFFKVPPLASNALLTMLHPLLENMLQTIDLFEISCLRAPFSWLLSPEISGGGICNEFCVWLGKSGFVELHQNIHHVVQISPHAVSGLLQP